MSHETLQAPIVSPTSEAVRPFFGRRARDLEVGRTREHGPQLRTDASNRFLEGFWQENKKKIIIGGVAFIAVVAIIAGVVAASYKDNASSEGNSDISPTPTPTDRASWDWLGPVKNVKGISQDKNKI